MEAIDALRSLVSATEQYLALHGAQPTWLMRRAYPELQAALRAAMQVIQEERPRMLIDTTPPYETACSDYPIEQTTL